MNASDNNAQFCCGPLKKLVHKTTAVYREMEVTLYELLTSPLEGTERRGRVVNTPASNSGGLRFKSRPGYRLS
jgi:hypothetical protein